MAITLIVAVLIGFVIYKALNAVFNVLPESGFKSFMLSNYGKALTSFLSMALLLIGLAYVMVDVFSIHC